MSSEYPRHRNGKSSRRGRVRNTMYQASSPKPGRIFIGSPAGLVKSLCFTDSSMSFPSVPRSTRAPRAYRLQRPRMTSQGERQYIKPLFLPKSVSDPAAATQTYIKVNRYSYGEQKEPHKTDLATPTVPYGPIPSTPQTRNIFYRRIPENQISDCGNQVWAPNSDQMQWANVHQYRPMSMNTFYPSHSQCFPQMYIEGTQMYPMSSQPYLYPQMKPEVLTRQNYYNHHQPSVFHDCNFPDGAHSYVDRHPEQNPYVYTQENWWQQEARRSYDGNITSQEKYTPLGYTQRLNDSAQLNGTEESKRNDSAQLNETDESKRKESRDLAEATSTALITTTLGNGGFFDETDFDVAFDSIRRELEGVVCSTIQGVQRDEDDFERLAQTESQTFQFCCTGMSVVKPDRVSPEGDEEDSDLSSESDDGVELGRSFWQASAPRQVIWLPVETLSKGRPLSHRYQSVVDEPRNHGNGNELNSIAGTVDYILGLDRQLPALLET